MATRPIIDFRENDLSQTIHGRDEILATIKQRGQFVMIDGVLLLCPERHLVVGRTPEGGHVARDFEHAPRRRPGEDLEPDHPLRA